MIIIQIIDSDYNNFNNNGFESSINKEKELDLNKLNLNSQKGTFTDNLSNRNFHDSDSFEIGSMYSKNIKSIQEYKNSLNEKKKDDQSRLMTNRNSNILINSDEINKLPSESININSDKNNISQLKDNLQCHSYNILKNDINGNLQISYDHSDTNNGENNDYLLLKRRKFTSDNKKKFSAANKSSTFNSEEMYKKFNNELEFKKMKNKINKKSNIESQINEKNRKEISPIKYENKTLEKIKEEEIIVKNEPKLNLDINDISKTVCKVKSKHSASLNYKFKINYYDSANANLNDNNPIFHKEVIDEKNDLKGKPKNKFLNSNSIYPQNFSPKNLYIKENHTNFYQNLSPKNLFIKDNNWFKKEDENLENKNSLKSIHSNSSYISNVSKDSSKYNYSHFIKKENSEKNKINEFTNENNKNYLAKSLINNSQEPNFLNFNNLTEYQNFLSINKQTHESEGNQNIKFTQKNQFYKANSISYSKIKKTNLIDEGNCKTNNNNFIGSLSAVIDKNSKKRSLVHSIFKYFINYIFHKFY